MMKKYLTIRQFSAATKLFKLAGGALWWRVGTGKTRVLLSIFAMIAKSDPDRKHNFVVICRRAAFYDWKNEVKKLKLDWNAYALDNLDLHYRSIPNRTTIYFVSHGMLTRNTGVQLGNISSTLSGIAFDEGFLFKNPASQHTKIANKLSERIQNAFVLSGSIMTAKDLTDVFGQLYAINRHTVLGRTLTEFRSKYMTKLQIGTFPILTPKRGAAHKVAVKVRNVASVFFPKDGQREILQSLQSIPASPIQLQYFKQLKEEWGISLKGEDGKEEIQDFKNAPTLIVKAQQISDGWIKSRTGVAIKIASPKLDMLVDKIRELIQCGEKQIIVWCAFRLSVETVLQRLQNEKKLLDPRSIIGMHGGLPFDTSAWAKRGRVAVATCASGSSVNHFSQCAYAIYYSQDFKWLNLQQSMGRTDRHDSVHDRCYYHFLHTKSSLDSFVYKTVQSSRRAETELIDYAKLRQWVNNSTN